MSEHAIALPATPRSALTARHFVVDTLEATPAKACSDVAALLVSELVANAVLHAQSPVEVRLTVDNTRVRVDVYDELSRLPEAVVGTGTFSGRGLQILQSLAHRWGATPLPDGGKIVWFELAAQ